MWLTLGSFCTKRHKVAPIVMVTNSATRWRNLHGFQFWTPTGTTCINYKFATRDTCIAILHALPWNVLLALSVSIGLVSSSARVTSVKFQKPLSVCQFETTGPIDRTPETPGSAKKSGIRDMKGACKSGQWIHL